MNRHPKSWLKCILNTVLVVLILVALRLAWSDSSQFEALRLRAELDRQTARVDQLLAALATPVATGNSAAVKLVDSHRDPPPLVHCRDEKDFKAIALRCGTDKVRDHAYQYAYQRYLGPLSLPGVAPFSMIEIGYAAGSSACVWREMLTQADQHSIEVGCTEANRAKHDASWIVNSPLFDVMLKEGRLHCGDGASGEFMAPILRSLRHPLTVVVDDGGHGPSEMAGSFTYLFPRIAPRGHFFMEDLSESYRVGHLGFVPKFVRPLLEDLHYRADDPPLDDPALNNLPHLAKFLRSVHCYQHLCIFERNDVEPLEP
jgi:hypothetical protein